MHIYMHIYVYTVACIHVCGCMHVCWFDWLGSMARWSVIGWFGSQAEAAGRPEILSQESEWFRESGCCSWISVLEIVIWFGN
jgi:hypothetical protein